MDRKLAGFLAAVARRLGHLPSSKRQRILGDIEQFLLTARNRQNLTYSALIDALGESTQFINGFLLSSGERPLRPPRRWWRTFLLALVALGVVTMVVVYSFFHYLNAQFDLDPTDGQIKLFGQIIDINQGVQGGQGVFSSGTTWAKKHVQQHFAVNRGVHFAIVLEQAKATVAYHDQDSYGVECEVSFDRQVAIVPRSGKVDIEIKGLSNCDFTFPRWADVRVTFEQGRVTMDQPVASFSVTGRNGHIAWVKHEKSRFKIFYDVKQGSIQGSLQDIFQRDATQTARLKLQSGDISFIPAAVN